MGMSKAELESKIPNFRGNSISNRSGELIGNVGFLESSLIGEEWEISIQVNVVEGLIAVYARYIGDDFGKGWLGEEKESKRKEFHKKYIEAMGFKQKKYDFGTIRCSLNKSACTNIISIVKR